MNHKFLHAILCVILLVGMVSVAPPQNAMARQDQPPLRLGLNFPINQLDPPLVETPTEAVVTDQLFLGLTGLDAMGNIAPALAVKWSVSDDGLTWTFYLQQGIRWVDSNGNSIRDVTAQDVSFSMNRALQYGNFQDLLGGVEVVDDYTAMIILTTPFPDFLTLLAVSPAAKILPQDLIEQNGDQWTAVGTIWTDGRYRLTDRSRQSVQLEANPAWSYDKIQFPSVSVEYDPDPRDTLQRYLRGDFDLIELNPDFRGTLGQEPGLVDQIQDIKGFYLQMFSGAPFTKYVGMDHSYLVKPYLLPVFSGCFGLGGFHLWGLNNNPPEVLVPGTTRVMDRETLGALTFIAEDQSLLVFSWMTPQLGLIFIGDIIVGDSTLTVGTDVAPYGFLRRVTNMYTDSAGNFVLETGLAALDEAIESGDQATDVPLETIYREEKPNASVVLQKARISPVAYAPPQAGLKVSFDEPIYDDDNNPSTTNDQVRVSGYVNIAPGAKAQMDLSIKNHQLQSFHFTNTLKQTAELKIYSEVSLLHFDKSVDLAKYTFAPITIFIGPVPVVIVPQLSVSVGFNGDISVNVSAGIDQSSTITTTASYESGTWNSNFSISDNQISPLTTQLTASASAGVTAGPKLSIMLYGVAGPYVKVNGYLTLSGDPSANPLWKLVTGIKGEIGVKVEVLSVIVVSYKYPFVIVPEYVLDQAGGVTPAPPVTPTPPVPPSCSSQWWPPSCWPLWLWVVAVLLAIAVLVLIFKRR